jgi:hypothetical protein
LQTKDNLRSPVELDADTIAYTSSPLFIDSEGRHRYTNWDFYLLRKGTLPVRLSDFRLYSLTAISAVNEQLFFTGSGGKVLPRPQPLAPDSSEVYVVELDRRTQSIRKPPGTLAPVFMIGGYSFSASVSSDGRHAAVLNTRTNIPYYRYDMVLATIDGAVQRRIDVEGIGFSPGVFVGETLLFNELFEDWYDVHVLDLASNTLQNILRVEHASDKLRALEQIRLIVQGAL